MNIPAATGPVNSGQKRPGAFFSSAAMGSFLTRVWIILATGVIMVAAVLAIVALHVFKFFWALLNKRRQKIA